MGKTTTAPLTERMRGFARGLFEGKSASAAYAAAYNKASTSKATRNSAHKLRKDPRVGAYILALRERQDTASLLTVEQKRIYLKGVVETPLSQLDEDSPFTKELTERESESGSSRTIKSFDKLRAIELDSKLAGDLAPDKHDHTLSVDPLAELVADIRTRQAT